MLNGSKAAGLSWHVNWSIKQCDLDIRRDHCSNVVLAGGTTLFPNFAERIRSDLQSEMHDSVAVEVVAPPNRKYSAWIGGSILSELSTFDHSWITSTSAPDANPPIVGYVSLSHALDADVSQNLFRILVWSQDDVGPRIVHIMCNM